MEIVAAACPFCHATHEYGAELVGRYTFCPSCRGRFYVEVPTLAESQRRQPMTGPKSADAAKPGTTLDDLLWDTQQGARYIMESLRRQEASARATRWQIAAMLVLGLANLAGVTYLLLR